MTHDELLDKLESIEYWQEQYANGTFLKALRAVIELHTPLPNSNKNKVDNCSYCSNHMHGHYYVYPCQTIQHIMRALNLL